MTNEKMCKDNRDAIDFGAMSIPKLYIKILIPTLLGMVSTIILTITDGYFVGNYAGSDSLAAVNIAVPLFMMTTALGLMFGAGCSIVAAVHLSKSNFKAANINVTQTFFVSLLIIVFLSTLILLSPEKVAYLFGSSDRLLPLVKTYIIFLTPALPFFLIETIGLFLIRLDGAPKYAMLCTLVPAGVNILGDFILVGVMGLGIKGAVLATSSCFFVGGVMVIIYFIAFNKQLKLYKLKFSKTSLSLMTRNIGYISKLGMPGFLGEIALAIMTFLGNYYFLKYLQEDGVAAYSVTCYYFPIVFMIYNAIAQSAQPIISYNYGLNDNKRVKEAFNLSLITIIIAGVVLTIGMRVFTHEMVSLFLKPGTQAYDIAVHGIPYFATGYLFFAINMVYIGYFQSIEKVRSANILTLFRGYIFLILSFIIVPELLGVVGIWLAIPIAELSTFFVLVFCYLIPYSTKRFRSDV